MYTCCMHGWRRGADTWMEAGGKWRRGADTYGYRGALTEISETDIGFVSGCPRMHHMSFSGCPACITHTRHMHTYAPICSKLSGCAHPMSSGLQLCWWHRALAALGACSARLPSIASGTVAAATGVWHVASWLQQESGASHRATCAWCVRQPLHGATHLLGPDPSLPACMCAHANAHTDAVGSSPAARLPASAWGG